MYVSNWSSQNRGGLGTKKQKTLKNKGKSQLGIYMQRMKMDPYPHKTYKN